MADCVRRLRMGLLWSRHWVVPGSSTRREADWHWLVQSHSAVGAARSCLPAVGCNRCVEGPHSGCWYVVRWPQQTTTTGRSRRWNGTFRRGMPASRADSHGSTRRAARVRVVESLVGVPLERCICRSRKRALLDDRSIQPCAHCRHHESKSRLTYG